MRASMANLLCALSLASSVATPGIDATKTNNGTTKQDNESNNISQDEEARTPHMAHTHTHTAVMPWAAKHVKSG